MGGGGGGGGGGWGLTQMIEKTQRWAERGGVKKCEDTMITLKAAL